MRSTEIPPPPHPLALPHRCSFQRRNYFLLFTSKGENFCTEAEANEKLREQWGPFGVAQAQYQQEDPSVRRRLSPQRMAPKNKQCCANWRLRLSDLGFSCCGTLYGEILSPWHGSEIASS